MKIKNPNRRDLLQAGGLAGLSLASPSLITGAYAAGPVINIVTSNSTLTNTILSLMDQKGYLKTFGVDAKTTNVADNSKVVPSLIGGDSDIAVVIAFSTLFPAMSRGAPLKLLGGGSLLYQGAVYAKDPAIKSVKDLAGKTIGTGAIGAAAQMMMAALLQKYNVDASKVTYQNVGSNADILRAVVGGTVDAGPSGLDVYDQASKFGIHALPDGNMWEQFPDYTYQAAFTSDQAIANPAKRDGLVRVLAAYATLFKYIQTPESKDSFVKAYVAATGKADSESEALSQWNFIQKAKPYATDIVLSEDRIKLVQDFNIKAGVQKDLVPYDKATDMSLAHDALKLMQQTKI
jgi:ABC-type nitrate/sulfonate/bicarbonate transport system substrate-binding protein